MSPKRNAMIHICLGRTLVPVTTVPGVEVPARREVKRSGSRIMIMMEFLESVAIRKQNVE